MNCRSFLKRIPELLDRDPDPAETDELTEHAGVCHKCATELDAATWALSTVSPSLKLTASPSLKERTMKQILTLDSQPNAIDLASTGGKSSIGHRWRYAVAAAAVLAVLALIALPVFKGSSSTVFADAMETLRKVSACTYTLTNIMEGTPTMQSRTSYKEPGRMRTDSGAPGMSSVVTSIMDLNKKKLVTLKHAQKQCVTFDLTGSATASQQDSATMGLFEELRRIPDSGAEPIGTKEIGGIEAVGFRAKSADRPGMSFVIWADPDRKRLLLVEFDFDNIKGMKGEVSDFDFDAQLDDSLFSLDPPEGYTVTEGQAIETEEPSEEAFIKFLRTVAEDTEGDFFPPSLDRAGLRKANQFRKKTAPNPPMSESERMKQGVELTRGLMFVGQMTSANDFHYAGEGIVLGNAQEPICWYKPAGAQDYRVIYGNLSVRDTAPGDLPSTATK